MFYDIPLDPQTYKKKIKFELKYDFLYERNITPANEHFDLHWHDFFEFDIVLNGCIDYIHNNKPKHAVRGTVNFLGFYDVHSINYKTECETIHISFKKEFIDNSLIEFLNTNSARLNCQLDEKDLNTVIDICNEIAYEKENEHVFNNLIIQGLLSKLIVFLVRKNNNDVEILNPDMIQKALLIINSNFSQDISLNSLAKQFFVSPEYFGKLFKKTVSRSFNEYLNMVRLQYACHLLSTTNFTTAEIAKNSGYTSPEYFFYCFKKYLNTTPSRYKRENNK